jgi:RHS repeat-associated protein
MDTETGFQFNRARYYDPRIGRWISQDPLGFDAGDSNLYRYVHDRSTFATDPSGLAEREITVRANYYLADTAKKVGARPKGHIAAFLHRFVFQSAKANGGSWELSLKKKVNWSYSAPGKFPGDMHPEIDMPDDPTIVMENNNAEMRVSWKESANLDNTTTTQVTGFVGGTIGAGIGLVATKSWKGVSAGWGGGTAAGAGAGKLLTHTFKGTFSALLKLSCKNDGTIVVDAKLQMEIRNSLLDSTTEWDVDYPDVLSHAWGSRKDKAIYENIS